MSQTIVCDAIKRLKYKGGTNMSFSRIEPVQSVLGVTEGAATTTVEVLKGKLY